MNNTWMALHKSHANIVHCLVMALNTQVIANKSMSIQSLYHQIFRDFWVNKLFAPYPRLFVLVGKSMKHLNIGNNWNNLQVGYFLRSTDINISNHFKDYTRKIKSFQKCLGIKENIQPFYRLNQFYYSSFNFYGQNCEIYVSLVFTGKF